MNETYPSPPSLRECLQALRRHWKKIVCVYVVTIAAAVAFLIYYPKSYASSAKLYVRMGRENVSVDPTVTASQMVMVQRSQDHEINSLLDILESRWLAEQVVDAVGVEGVLAGASGQAEEADAPGGGVARQLQGWFDQAVAAIASPVSDRDRAIEKVLDGTTVSAPKESTVITIAAKARSPEQAQRIAAATTDAFTNAHLQLNRTRGTHEFFAEQSTLLHDQLTRVKQDIRDRKNEFGMLSIEGSRSALEQEISTIGLQTRATERDLSAAQMRAQTLQEQFAQVAPQVTGTVEGVAHEAWDRMREALYGVELAEVEANANLTPEHPVMASIARQREEAARILEGQVPERTQVSTNPNPTHQALELDLKRQLAEVAALQSSHELLSRQAAELNEDLNALNTHELEVEDLERKADLLQANYLTHAEKLEEARIDDALNSERISSLNVVQPATLETKPVSPKRAVTLFSALVLATFLGLLAALFSEYSNPLLQVPEQVEAALDLPVLATIPRTSRFRAVSHGGVNER